MESLLLILLLMLLLILISLYQYTKLGAPKIVMSTDWHMLCKTVTSKTCWGGGGCHNKQCDLNDQPLPQTPCILPINPLILLFVL